jgi:hypothetical protein
MKYLCESAQRDTRTCWAWRQHLLWFVDPSIFGSPGPGSSTSWSSTSVCSSADLASRGSGPRHPVNDLLTSPLLDL